MIKLSKNRKVLIENFISLSALQILTALSPFLVLPYVLRVIGQSGYGVFAMAFALIGYFTTLTDYGFTVLAPRDIAVVRDDKNKLNEVYSKVIYTKFLFFLVSIVILIFLILFAPAFRDFGLSYLCALPMLLGTVLFTEWFFQGIEQMKFITFVNIFVRLLFTFSVFVFVTQPEDYNLYILLQSSGHLLSGLFTQLIARRKFGVRFIKIPIRDVVKVIQENFQMFVNMFLPNLYNAGGVVLLGIFYAHDIVGTYESLHKITTIALTLVTISTTVFFPHVSRNRNAFKKVARISLLAGGLSFLIAILGTPVVFWYLNISEFAYYLPVYWVLCLNILSLTFSKTYGQNFLVTHGAERKYVKSTLISSLVGAVLICTLIWPLSALGAAITLTFSNALGAYLCFFYAKIHLNRCEL